MCFNKLNQDNLSVVNKINGNKYDFSELTQEHLAPLINDLELLSQQDRDDLNSAANIRSAQNNLLKNNSLIRKIIRLSPNIIYIYDLEQKRNVYLNFSVGKFLGYLPAEINSMSGQLFEKRLHQDDVELLARHHHNCRELRLGDYLEIQYRLQDKKGNWQWLESKDTVFERDALGKTAQILGVIQNITEVKRNQLEASQLNLELAEKVSILETWRYKRLKLATINEFLQACLTIEEAEIAIADLLQPLFPNTSGKVYLINNSENLLQAVATWGTPKIGSSFEPHDCWALRLGNKHVSYPSTPGIYCKHADSNTRLLPTLCLPLIAKGKALGMLHLCFNSPEPISELIQELSATVAQNLAMSFASLMLQEKLRYQSLRDPLTGLYNRRFLEESLEKEIDRAQRQHQSIGIIMLDIDRFKRFNDLYGHAIGDLVLRTAGHYLHSEVRQYDVACRYGGEELVIIMPNATIEDTITRAEEIRLGFKQLKLEHNNKIIKSITVSIGVSCFPNDGIDASGLIQTADRALYQAKEAGRDCVRHC